MYTHYTYLIRYIYIIILFCINFLHIIMPNHQGSLLFYLKLIFFLFFMILNYIINNNTLKYIYFFLINKFLQFYNCLCVYMKK